MMGLKKKDSCRNSFKEIKILEVPDKVLIYFPPVFHLPKFIRELTIQV
jgi:hypothetical protein